jgi:hypothetical protein
VHVDRDHNKPLDAMHEIQTFDLCAQIFSPAFNLKKVFAFPNRCRTAWTTLGRSQSQKSVGHSRRLGELNFLFSHLFPVRGLASPQLYHFHRRLTRYENLERKLKHLRRRIKHRLEVFVCFRFAHCFFRKGPGTPSACQTTRL